MSNYLVGKGAHIDGPLTNIAVEAFNSGGDFVAPLLFPVVPVAKQSDGYYVVDPAAWLRVRDTERARKQAPKMGEFQVSTDTYFADNWAFATSNALEDLANADTAIRLRQQSTRFTMDVLRRDHEIRVANKVTSISNCGSGVALTGTDQWSDYVNSDPISDVQTGHAFIENTTGLKPNTLLLDKDTYRILRFHPVIRDYAKYTNAGPVPVSVLQEVFEVERLLVASGIKNNAKENQAASMTNIWGKNALLARVDTAAAGLQTMTFGLGMRWQPDGFPAAMAVERYMDPDPGKKAEIVATQFFQDDKIVAPDLSYLITGTVA